MKKPFVTAEQLEDIAARYPTPFHLYDAQGIRENARRLKAAFSWNPGYREYFAVRHAHACHPQDPAGGGLRLRLFLHDGADDLGAVRHHR